MNALDLMDKLSIIYDPEMLSGFRHVAVNMLNNTKTFKAGLKRKQKKAAMSTQYLSEVLEGCGVS